MSTKQIDDHRQRIASILAEAPWEKSKSAQMKAERERRAMARRNRPAPKCLSEYHEQRLICEWLLWAGVSHFAVPNETSGGNFDPVRWSMNQAIGAKSGVPDLILVDLASDGHPTVLEMKRARGGRLTERQKYWAELFPAKGWHHVVGYGATDAIDKLQELGYGKGTEKTR